LLLEYRCGHCHSDLQIVLKGEDLALARNR
jgi:Zn finger protein HypA/HybF involved in hydrogenase expression